MKTEVMKTEVMKIKILTAEQNIYFGTNASEYFYGHNGVDQIFAGGGNDVLFGYLGDDLLDGGSGHDLLFGFLGADQLYGGSGNDLLLGYLGADLLDGGSGEDTAYYIHSRSGITIDLGVVDDQGYSHGTGGTAEGDRLINIENLTASKYDDHLAGNDADNIISGLSGNDVIGAGLGDNTLDGGEGDDLLISDMTGSNTLNGQDGNDTVSYANAAVGINISLATGTASALGDNPQFAAFSDRISEVENVIGSDFIDTIMGNDADNVLNGGKGGDLFIGNGGQDTVTYATSDAGVYVDLGANPSFPIFGFGPVTYLGEGFGGDAEGDSFTSIEALIGSEFDDTLIGGRDANTLTGGNGHDTLNGNSASNTLTGGEGVDIFEIDMRYFHDNFSTVSANDDTTIITDFGTGNDIIRTNIAPEVDGNGDISLDGWRQDGDDAVYTVTESFSFGDFSFSISQDVLVLEDVDLSGLTVDDFEFSATVEFA